MHIRNSFSRVVLNAKIYVVLKTQANLFNHVLKLSWKKTSQASGVRENFRVRTFQVVWYNNYSWITLCGTSYLVFCHYCRKAKRKGLLTFSSKQEKAFTLDGFGNWKKTLRRFKEHESSQCHKESMEKIILMHQPSVASKLATELENSQALHC